MACDTRLKPNQTISERAREVRSALDRLVEALKAGRARIVWGPQNSITFAGWDATSKDGVTDACAYRMLMNNALGKQLIERAELLAGRKVNRQALGVHSHDGGQTWHRH